MNKFRIISLSVSVTNSTHIHSSISKSSAGINSHFVNDFILLNSVMMPKVTSKKRKSAHPKPESNPKRTRNPRTSLLSSDQPSPTGYGAQPKISPRFHYDPTKPDKGAIEEDEVKQELDETGIDPNDRKTRKSQSKPKPKSKPSKTPPADDEHNRSNGDGESEPTQIPSYKYTAISRV